MKKITVALLFLFGFFAVGFAQTSAPTQQQSTKVKKEKTNKTDADKAAIASQKKADKEAKKIEKKQQHDAMVVQKKADNDANSGKSSGLNKDGTPDKRLKANKQTKAQLQAQPQAPVQVQPRPQTQVTARTQPKVRAQTKPPVIQGTNTSTDKAIGTDAEGRTIYEGPKGGHYYIDKNGNKEYIKKK